MRTYNDTAALAAGEGHPAEHCILLNSQVSMADTAVLSYGPATRLINAIVSLKEGARLVIGRNCTLRGQLIVEKGGTVVLADDVTMTEPCKIRSVEGAAIHIGEGSLFSSVTVYSGDYHGLYDEGGARLNPPQDVVIGAAVWLAMGAMILKGTEIGEGSVVGAGSVVSGKFPPRVVIAGNPAKVVRTGIRWNRKPLDHLPDTSQG